MRAGAGVLALLALAVAGCDRSDPAGPGETTVSEAKALDEAADMIEARKPPAPLVAPTGPLPPSPTGSADEASPAVPATDNNSSPPG